MIGIIGALDIEVNALSAAIHDARERTVSGIKYSSGTIFGNRVVVARSGVGKVNAAVCAQTMILLFGADVVINTGVAGGIDRTLRVGDIVIGTHAVQHDFDTTAFGDAPGMRFELSQALGDSLMRAINDLGEARALSGVVATGDQFVASAEAKARISGVFGAKACDMEGAAIAQVCALNQKPCALMRAISDGADDGAPVSFDEFARMAAERSARALMRYLEAYTA